MVAAGVIPPVYFWNARVSLERELAPIRQRLAPMQERQREIWEMSDGIAHISRQGASW